MVFSLVIAGCASSTPPTDFYTLSSLARVEERKPGARFSREITLGIGPVTLPQYLDRPQIVTRPSPNRLELAEFHRWGSSLGQDFSRVLAENLSIFLPAQHILAYPWDERIPINYQIALAVHRFEGKLGEYILLDIQWMVFDQMTRKVLFAKRSKIRQPMASADYEALVFAKSQALAALGRQIADEIISRDL
jgi:uncharacterized lipoprotein YmbA